jgi:hypothetical protein
MARAVMEYVLDGQIPVFANEILDEVGLQRNLYTSKDKAQVVQGLKGDDSILVYVGDSVTDLDSWIAADIKICILSAEIWDSKSEPFETFTRLRIRPENTHEGIVNSEWFYKITEPSPNQLNQMDLRFTDEFRTVTKWVSD